MKILIGALLLVLSCNSLANDDDLHIGFILWSEHLDDESFSNKICEIHNGVYLKKNRWSVGEYDNSVCEKSQFLSYESEKVNGVSVAIALANGYEKHDKSVDGWLLIPSVGYQESWLNIRVGYKLLFFVAEFNINPL